MKALQIIRAKPNPSGKDRFLLYIPPQQLAGEWIEFKNAGNESFKMDWIVLYHKTFDRNCAEIDFEKVLPFKGVLKPGEIVRVHSGPKIPFSQMAYEDATGADHHLFTFKNYIWNNICGDKPGLWNEILKAWEDLTYYDPRPPEGVILRRIGNKLVP